MSKVLFAATSYPRSASDWQGIFIRRIADALAETPGTDIRVWAPEGPRHPRAASALTPGDARFLERLTSQGGIAHLLRTDRVRAALAGVELTARLHAAYRRNQPWADVFHINWLQCALGHTGLRGPLLVTVLGSDLALLERSGMVSALKVAFRRKRVVLCPNAEWMVAPLAAKLGDVCTDIVYAPFGVDAHWFNVERVPAAAPRVWITVLRATKKKIGALFEWTRDMDHEANQFHLFGPLQEPIDIPSWIHHHGPVTPEALARDWYPRATGMISLSQHDEGRPQVMLEAMASGVPIIASPIPAHANLIDNGRTGLLCDTREQFAGTLEAVATSPLGNTLADNARAMIRSAYGTWTDCASRYCAVYEQLTAKQ